MMFVAVKIFALFHSSDGLPCAYGKPDVIAMLLMYVIQILDVVYGHPNSVVRSLP